ncbi:hypothetical protein Tco_0805673, partial [Tanacetum coccineum]
MRDLSGSNNGKLRHIDTEVSKDIYKKLRKGDTKVGKLKEPSIYTNFTSRVIMNTLIRSSLKNLEEIDGVEMKVDGKLENNNNGESSKREEKEYKRNHVPAFGSWDCNDDLPFTQCFETARQAGLLRYSYSEDRDLYVTGDLYDNNVVTPAMIVVPRRA